MKKNKNIDKLIEHFKDKLKCMEMIKDFNKKHDFDKRIKRESLLEKQLRKKKEREWDDHIKRSILEKKINF
jgi:ABC-type transport system involved in cytochrome bd biosynthesis fused ATPase/permease subunit